MMCMLVRESTAGLLAMQWSNVLGSLYGWANLGSIVNMAVLAFTELV